MDTLLIPQGIGVTAAWERIEIVHSTINNKVKIKVPEAPAKGLILWDSTGIYVYTIHTVIKTKVKMRYTINLIKTAAWRYNTRICLGSYAWRCIHLSQYKELLHTLIENNRNDFLKRSLWQQGWISLREKKRCCLRSVDWSWCDGYPWWRAVSSVTSRSSLTQMPRNSDQWCFQPCWLVCRSCWHIWH